MDFVYTINKNKENVEAVEAKAFIGGLQTQFWPKKWGRHSVLPDTIASTGETLPTHQQGNNLIPTEI